MNQVPPPPPFSTLLLQLSNGKQADHAMALATSAATSYAVAGSSQEFGDMRIGVFRAVDRVAVPQVALGSSGRRRVMAKPAQPVQPGRSDSVVPQASSLATPEVGEEVEKEDYEALAKELENASPLEIMDRALAKFGSDIAIAFRTGIENLARLENRQDPWLVVLYAPWCQAMEGSYVEVAEKLAESGVKVGKFRADRDQKAFAEKELQLGSFPTILFFPKHASIPIKYPSEKRDVHSWLAFVRALQ